jgi:uncharacterized membrane protein
MSTLIAVAYPDAQTAEQVRAELIQATKEHLLRLEDAVVVEHRPDGKIKLHQASHPSRSGAAGGVLWGGFIGLLFLVPLLGMAMGAATGAAAGKLADDGIDDTFMKQLAASIPPGGAARAALIALGSTEARDRVVARVGPYGGTIIQTSLSPDDEERLRSALGEAAGVA